MNIAVLGIGQMGYRLARRLCEVGYNVHAWNRTRQKAEQLAPIGATIHADAAQAVRAADFVLCFLDNGPVVDEVLFAGQVAQALQPDTLVIDFSSISPSEARDHAARLSAIGISHLDAPMSGGTLGAEQGTLAIMVGGKPAAFGRAEAIFQVFGRATHVGPHGAGQLAKLANQMIVGITIGAVAEALLLCEKGGAKMAKVREAIMGGFADSRVLQVHGQRMLEGDFAPYGRMSIQLNDLRNVLATAKEIGFDAPVTQMLERLYSDGIAHGLGDLDQSALFIELASRNGMSAVKDLL